MPKLVGKRIVLREYRQEDFEFIKMWVTNPLIVDNLSDIFLYANTVNQTEAFLNMMLENKSDNRGFIIADKETEEYIGQIDFVHIDWKNRTAEIGIVIGSEENLGKGYGSEAIRVLEDFAFNRLNLHKLQLKVYEFNQRGYKCYLKCGFKEEGRIRENYFIYGKYHDTIHMGILKEEYKQIASAL